ncbi:MAG: thioredoxin family protein [Ferruginibacter sp.]|nr:thioredoxin family protein [Ferruginibacter sp.]
MTMNKKRIRFLRGLVTVLLFILSTLDLTAQEKKLYDPSANAKADIAAAIRKAAAENKFVLIQAGGNWCKWCLEFARFAQVDPVVDSVMKSSFVWYHLNWSKENENLDIFKQYHFPQRFGFPVFLVLNQRGELIHTQNSEYLENGNKSYDSKKVASFLEMWSPAALEPAKYNR